MPTQGDASILNGVAYYIVLRYIVKVVPTYRAVGSSNSKKAQMGRNLHGTWLLFLWEREK